ncbi:hypothetical protein RhiirB3_457439 [Rhizophagus irregularis]|nr:hypothetical protein RhiirB3_457439 [Rhizophagus irregularis]
MIANDNQIFHNTRGVLIDSNQIMDLLKHQPKSRLVTKQLKSSFEKSGLNKVKNRSEQVISDDKGLKIILGKEYQPERQLSPDGNATTIKSAPSRYHTAAYLCDAPDAFKIKFTTNRFMCDEVD